MENEFKYKDYKKIIFKLAYQWDAGLDNNLDDLISAGNEAFVAATKKFNPDLNVKFSTYLYAAVNNALCNYKTRVIKKHWNDIALTEVSHPKAIALIRSKAPDAYEVTRFKQIFEKLSKESKFIAKLCWETPKEIIDLAIEEKSCPKVTLGLITRYLLMIGWQWPKIRGSFKEIRKSLK